jgi:hypothetical protein
VVEDDFNAVLRRVHELELAARAEIQELDRQTAAKEIDPRLDQLIMHCSPGGLEVVDFLERSCDIIAQAASAPDRSNRPH